MFGLFGFGELRYTGPRKSFYVALLVGFVLGVATVYWLVKR